uniref:Sodium-dependent multivitamin transporter-like n=1 Tax=Saccoglossus kowalevskii TaxID=10224 RepID=A0ABM0MCU2_SACKO|nr:PREDICTED: sodium-dependent multivitamin transporter-like [Saccoglossus kowalevskii]
MGPFVVISNTIFGTSGGPLLGVFTLGMFYKRSNTCGALIGMVVGFCCGLWVSVGAIVTKNSDDALEIYKLSFMWYSTFSWSITVILGITSSEIYRCIKPSITALEIDPMLLVTFLRPTTRRGEYQQAEEIEPMTLKELKRVNSADEEQEELNGIIPNQQKEYFL